MIRILYVTHFAGRFTGAEQHLLNTLRELDKEKYKAYVILRGDDRQGRFTGALQELGIEYAVVPFRIIELHKPCFTGSPDFNDFLNDNLAAAAELGKLIRGWRIDVVDSNVATILAGLLAARLENTGHIQHYREIFPATKSVALLHWLHGTFSDVVFAVSDCVARASGRAGAATLYEGVTGRAPSSAAKEELRVRLGIPRGRLVIGCMSALVGWKGQEVLVQACGRLRQERPDLPLTIVLAGDPNADPEHIERVKQAAEAYGISEHVVFTGFVDDPAALLAQFDISVVPSISPDPLPNTVAESMAAGAPVIASRCGGIPEVIAHRTTGFLVSPGAAVELSDAIAELADDRELRSRLSSAAKEFANHRFNCSVTADKLQRTYRRLSGRRLLHWWSGLKLRALLLLVRLAERWLEYMMAGRGSWFLGVVLLPVRFIVGAGWLAAWLGTCVKRVVDEERPAISLPAPALENGKISVVIPNYNGIANNVIRDCLSSLLASKDYQRYIDEVIVVDDCSYDASCQVITSEFPQVKLLRNELNQGFLRSSNRGMRAATGEYVFLVNSDVVFTERWIGPLLESMRDPQVAAVSPQLRNLDRTTFQSGVNLARFPGGHIMVFNESQSEVPGPARAELPTIYAVGAALLMRKRHLVELNYFDELYCPSNWEDIDICYRAWKKGYAVWYQPGSVLYHHLHLTIDRSYSDYNIATLAAKNEYTFIWKNIHEPKYLVSHLLKMPGRLLGKLHEGRLAELHGLVWALSRLPTIMYQRMLQHVNPVWTDAEIFARVEGEYLNQLARQQGKKKLLFVTQELPWPLDTGGKNRNYTLLQRASRELDIYLLALAPKWQEADLQRLGFCAGVRAVRKSFHPVDRQMDGYPDTIIENSETELYDVLNEVVDAWGPEIICYDSLMVSAYMLLKEVTIPTVYVEHDIGMIDYRDSYLWRHRNGNKLMWFAEAMKLLAYEHKIASLAEELVVLTDYDRAYLRALGVTTPMTIIPTAADQDKFRPLPERQYNDLPALVYVGHFGHYPNVSAIVDFCRATWPRLKRVCPGLRLKIIGSAPTPEVVRLGENDEAIEVTGYVEDLPAALEGDYIFIAPIMQRGGIRGKILQAMSMALPVVASSAAVLGFAPAARSAVRTADSPDTFIEQIRCLAADRDARQREGQAAREALQENYSWSVSADSFVQVVKRAAVRARNYPVRTL